MATVKMQKNHLNDAQVIRVISQDLQFFHFRRFQIRPRSDLPDLDVLAAGTSGDQVPVNGILDIRTRSSRVILTGFVCSSVFKADLHLNGKISDF